MAAGGSVLDQALHARSSGLQMHLVADLVSVQQAEGVGKQPGI